MWINLKCYYLQKETFSTEQRKKLSDSAKKLFSDEPDLFEVTTREYSGNYPSSIHI